MAMVLQYQHENRLNYEFDEKKMLNKKEYYINKKLLKDLDIIEEA